MFTTSILHKPQARRFARVLFSCDRTEEPWLTLFFIYVPCHSFKTSSGTSNPDGRLPPWYSGVIEQRSEHFFCPSSFHSHFTFPISHRSETLTTEICPRCRPRLLHKGACACCLIRISLMSTLAEPLTLKTCLRGRASQSNRGTNVYLSLMQAPLTSSRFYATCNISLAPQMCACRRSSK